MTERISLAEAYNNKDVITQIAILKDKLDSIPDADLTNVVLKTGDQVIDGEKTFNDPIVANGGVVFANSGIHVNGTLEVDGDIIQNGSAYETHAEQVFSKNDLIVTREDAIGALAAGTLSGIRVKKYDGVSDLNLGVDSAGIMRVGDLGQEQPLATREEAANMTSGALVKWDGVNNRMIAPASNVGSDAKPVKVVGGELIPVAKDLVAKEDLFFKAGDTYSTPSSFVFYGFVANSTDLFIDIKLPKLLDRAATISITSIEVKGVNAAMSSGTNPVQSVTPNVQTFDTVRLGVKFTNAHGLTADRPCTGFISYSITVS